MSIKSVHFWCWLRKEHFLVSIYIDLAQPRSTTGGPQSAIWAVKAMTLQYGQAESVFINR